MDGIISVTSLENGNHYLELLRSEHDKLERLIFQAERELEDGRDLPEEVSGKLRIAAGKAKLLMDQKFNQFEQLCHKNLDVNSKDHFRVTCEDLAGYWDVVMIQISQIHNVFQESYALINQNQNVL